MSTNPISFDTKNTSSKETVRKNIRHALASKSSSKFPNIDLTSELFDPLDNVTIDFVNNFRNAGGKYIPCTKENFMERLIKLIKSQQYKSILNTSSSLDVQLTKNNIFYYNSIDSSSPVDAVIVYSNLLIARTGSMIFSQKNSLYPSVRNLGKDMIVVAFANHIISDLKEALNAQQQINGANIPPVSEIITPTLPELVDGKEIFSPSESRIILLLVS
jgi:L-lactate utilization protein LutC